MYKLEVTLATYMNTLNILDEILTEFDEAISSELNVDPLGLLVIWSSYGQDIFRRRISSISNDVRNTIEPFQSCGHSFTDRKTTESSWVKVFVMTRRMAGGARTPPLLNRPA